MLQHQQKFLYYERFAFSPSLTVAEISVIQDGNTYELQVSPTSDEYQLSATNVTSTFVMTASIKQKNGRIAARRIYANTVKARNITTGEEVPLITFSNPVPFFGPRVLKLNKIVQTEAEQ
jgi:hypothetical protein